MASQHHPQDTGPALEAKDRGLAGMQERTSRLQQELDQEKLERTQENQKYHAAQRSWTEELDRAKMAVHKLSARNEKLKTACENMQEDMNAASERHEFMMFQQDSLGSRLRESEEERQRLQALTVVLRGMVTKNSEPDGERMDDNAIVGKFIKLREQVQRIASKLCFSEGNGNAVLTQEMSDAQRDFEYWKGLSQAQLLNRIRTNIFELIHSEILGRPLFGLEGLQDTSGLEHGLSKFETALNNLNPGHKAAVLEWRVRTVRCASLLNIDNPRAEEVAKYIHEFMKPLITSDALDTQLRTLILKLCNDSMSFALLLRSFKDLYRCEMPDIHSPLNDDSEEQCPEPYRNGDPHAEGDVAFVLAGSLVKYPELHPERRLVLEKAHVVVFKKTE
ncbi:hypothetical protein MBM_05472 [Drepanopeziza brunnea f. sp. 'multigermtubi' MB_m1]|uniref:Involucrin repeat protein n=2 Tax=Drepanopeziza brunnea f. sp. 'multigermtubi' TaxID=698441 RepID=K1X6C0_MARBU|nr:uncharacterized protein MBM_05472 [Drepanopeziza brunnea f. sp. 'multigermtubi' MB_m1]EKD16178.1 hypothetical protein MBM_05472 [Drepanopeziza brunnea f. sp. 'multigermtubi' MB_m1]